MSEQIKGSKIELGAQNVYLKEAGAFTGEISPNMILDTGATWSIIGHSERRTYFGDDDKTINAKILMALKSGLKVIFCVGETLEQREQELTEEIVSAQLEWGLQGVPKRALDKIIIAYEPVWAIGTGKTATPEQAQDVHAFIRDILSTFYNEEASQQMTILYGGSMKPENADGLLAKPDIDGGLIGGACLKADSFISLIKSSENN